MPRPFLKITTLFLLFCLTVLSCKKGKENSSDRHLNKGVIIGYNTETCSCCAGLLINFKPNEPVSVTNPPKLIKNDPAEFGINSSTQFPINVDVEWTQNLPPAFMTCALGNLILITKYKQL